MLLTDLPDRLEIDLQMKRKTVSIPKPPKQLKPETKTSNSSNKPIG
jgi:hypothetical protein